MTVFIPVLPVEIRAAVRSAQLAEAYERAKEALAVCDRIDEVDDWADKAAALATWTLDKQTIRTLKTLPAASAPGQFGASASCFASMMGAGDEKTETPPDICIRSRAEAAEAAGISPTQGERCRAGRVHSARAV